MNTFQLKIIGLILMTLDHMYQYFKLAGVPIWFNWLGRVVAPIFAFTAVEGYYHTRDRFKYMRRLYVSSLLMSIGNIIVPMIISRPDGMTVPNNIFSTLFLITVYIKAIELLAEGRYSGDRKKLYRGLVLGIVPIASGFIASAGYQLGGEWAYKAISAVLPNPFITEGGPVFIMIGLIMYFLRQDRVKMVAIYSFISLSMLVSGELTVQRIFFENYQWMMVFSAVFFLLYNGQKGRGVKYLFYAYYPGHIYFFYVLSAILMLK